MNFLIILLCSMLIALAICMAVRSQMKTAQIATTASDYIPKGGFKLTAQSDEFLYMTTSRKKIEKDSSSTNQKDSSSSNDDKNNSSNRRSSSKRK